MLDSKRVKFCCWVPVQSLFFCFSPWRLLPGHLTVRCSGLGAWCCWPGGPFVIMSGHLGHLFGGLHPVIVLHHRVRMWLNRAPAASVLPFCIPVPPHQPHQPHHYHHPGHYQCTSCADDLFLLPFPGLSLFSPTPHPTPGCYHPQAIHHCGSPEGVETRLREEGVSLVWCMMSQAQIIAVQSQASEWAQMDNWKNDGSEKCEPQVGWKRFLELSLGFVCEWRGYIWCVSCGANFIPLCGMRECHGLSTWFIGAWLLSMSGEGVGGKYYVVLIMWAPWVMGRSWSKDERMHPASQNPWYCLWWTVRRAWYQPDEEPQVYLSSEHN